MNRDTLHIVPDGLSAYYMGGLSERISLAILPAYPQISHRHHG